MMPALIAHPVAVYLRIVARLVAVDAPAMVMDVDRASALASGAHRGRAMQVPHAHPEAKVFFSECADRTDIDHVAGVFVIDRTPRVDVDLVMIAALEDRQLAGMRDFVEEARA